ncbi:hypothetical protein LTR37_015511 [Vermiconidia calcicola]|uniref:Uncharacterized protein n=1 Tax=Vermiconidia calcicola TaxID=1690605 RepID=A0ACC3MQK4_9PEZI|nr:hypothetical protein LTR37_015511 [Vermiconidia calcicola]
MTSTTLGDNCKLEVALVTVDSRCETTFEIPKAWLTQTSVLLKRDYVNAFKSLNGISFDGFADQDSADAPQKKTVYLPNVYTSHFFDFQRWLRKGRILPATASYAPPWVVEGRASRLVDAIKLAIVLESKEYQKAAMNEFLWTARFLEWPEDYVNTIFDITEASSKASGRAHPARRMIAAIIAAKTVGPGKRKIREGPGEKDGDGRISRSHFWEMYDYHVKSNDACHWPEGYEEFL